MHQKFTTFVGFFLNEFRMYFKVLIILRKYFPKYKIFINYYYLFKIKAHFKTFTLIMWYPNWYFHDLVK